MLEFGKIIKRKVDMKGNVEEIEKNIVGGEVNLPIRKTIEERVKIYSQKEEFEEYIKFSDMIHGDPDIVSPVFRIETSKNGQREGYYFVIKSYTKLERNFDKSLL